MSSVPQYQMYHTVITSITATVQVLTACCCIFFMVAILANRSVRTQAYNLYLVFLIFPDASHNISQAALNILWVANDFVYPPGHPLGAVSSWIWNFYYVANFYLNGVVAYEVHVMVQNSYNRRRTAALSLRRVTTQAACTYTGAGFVATWPWLPLGVSWVSLVVIFLSFLSIPAIYVVYVRLRIRKLLPSSGRTKALSLYFMRILIVFFVFYIPGLVINLLRMWSEAESQYVTTYWLDLGMQMLYPAQALTTLCMAAQKDDIYEAMAQPLRASRLTVASWKKKKSPSVTITASTNNCNMSEENPGLEHKQMQQEEEQEEVKDAEENLTSIWEAEDVYDNDGIGESSITPDPPLWTPYSQLKYKRKQFLNASS